MTLPERPAVAGLSGERFRAVYHLTGDKAEARAKAEDITIEQTIEFPADLAPAGDIRDHIIGRIERLRRLKSGRWEAVISYAVETAGPDLAQFLNVIFGNISIKPGIRLMQLDLPPALLARFKGPRFGRAGVRQLVNVHGRPLMCSALKPMGLSSADLADMAYRFALGGLDLIKDDHGLANQPFSPFQARVEQCAAAVARANRETGLNCLYLPNITAPADKIVEYARFARDAGAGGLLICPGIVGFDTMRALADDDSLNLPIMSHPSFYGSMVTSPRSGISHYALYGQLQRLAGADMSVYPNFGGRFAFSVDECRSIVAGTQDAMGHLKPCFPAPGGGMTMEKVPLMNAVYGAEVVYLIGGGLHRHSRDLTANVRYFMRLIQPERLPAEE
ncbi:MAG: RuBisCO large subunit C-terminal-like domain-containing protein [Aggregatilineales bacterium]